MKSTDIAISVSRLSKSYQLGALGVRSAKEDFHRWLTSLVNSRTPSVSNKTLFRALNEIGFDIRKGEKVGVIGRNGAGKSTLLKILSRVTKPTSGEAVIYGRMASLLEVGTGFHPELTGRENIFLNGAILGMSRPEILSRFKEIVEFAEIGDFLDTPVKRYSSGMYVKLAFSVAAHLETEILIVDEVLAVGDVSFQKKCLGKIQEIGKQERTVLFVSHNLATVSRVCNRGLVLSKGNLVFDGPVDQAIRHYLAETISSTSHWEHENDPSKAICINRVKVLNSRGEESQELPYNEVGFVEVSIRVNKPETNCTIWVQLETQDGVPAFCSCDYDADPSRLGQRSLGESTYRLQIPSHLLNSGRYTVVVGAVRNHPLEIFERIEAVNFEVLDIGTPASVLESGTRRGVVQPILSWKLVDQK